MKFRAAAIVAPVAAAALLYALYALYAFTRAKLPRRTLPAPPSRAQDLSCFLYDRPPRTGSTTIFHALRNCTVLHHGFAALRSPQLQDEYAVVDRMLRLLQGPRRSLVEKHAKLARPALAALRARCRRLLYVTSCRPMRERLWSRQKYRAVPGNVNSTLTDADHDHALKKLRTDTRNEPFLEAHPYLERGEIPAELEDAERLVPDYVIRNGQHGKFTEDLQKLLAALGCDPHFTPTNVHESDRDREVVKGIKLKLGDKIYKKLVNIAEAKNEMGLEKARQFMREAAEERERDLAEGEKNGEELAKTKSRRKQ